jgi:hypothetical protein
VSTYEEGKQTVYLHAEIVKDVGPSFVIDTADGTRCIPKSQIRDDSEVTDVGEEGCLAIPRWLAEDRDLEYEEDPV